MKAVLHATSVALVLTLAAARAYAQDAASTPFHRASPAAEASPARTPEPSASQPPTEEPEEEAVSPTPLPSNSPKSQQKADTEVTAPTGTPATARGSLPPVRSISPRPEGARPVPKASPATEEQPAAPREARATAVDSGNVPDTIKRLEQQWETAIQNHDPSVVERVVADDFVGVSSSGRIGDKLTLIYEAKRDKNVYKTASAHQMRVYTFGSKVAVVLGLTRESGTTSSGRPFDHSYRFTDSWMERDGKWQCIAAHASVAAKR
jgi:ketosteroid isomerase-like protein